MDLNARVCGAVSVLKLQFAEFRQELGQTVRERALHKANRGGHSEHVYQSVKTVADEQKVSDFIRFVDLPFHACGPGARWMDDRVPAILVGKLP